MRQPNNAVPPFVQGDWITIAYAHSSAYAPAGQRVWQATSTPVFVGWASCGNDDKRVARFCTDGGDGVSAAHFRKATREDIAAEVERLTKAIAEMNERRLLLAAACGVAS